MSSHMVLLAALIGHTAYDGLGAVPVLSQETRMAQAQALAVLRANHHNSQPKIIAQYQLENERLRRRVQVVNVATSRNWSLTARTSLSGEAVRSDGFSSVPPNGPATSSNTQNPPTLDELRRERFLLNGDLHDSRFLYREANRFYQADYPIRYRRAGWGMR